MDKARPYLTAAFLCEKVLQEKDGSVSAIRIVDRMTYRVEGLPTGLDLRPAIPLSFLIAIKSGPVTGTHTVKLLVEKPNGDRKEVFSHLMEFIGREQGQNFIVNFALGTEQDGLYWFDVVFDEEVLSRTPLTVEQQPSQTPPEQKS